jgi:AAA domain
MPLPVNLSDTYILMTNGQRHDIDTWLADVTIADAARYFPYPQLWAPYVANAERQLGRHTFAIWVQLVSTQRQQLNGTVNTHREDFLVAPQETDEEFVERLSAHLQDAIYPGELINAPEIMQRCGVIKRRKRALYKGRLWPKLKRIMDLDPWEWDREIDAYAYAADRLVTVPLSSITPVDVQWLWYPYVPYEKLTLVEGDPATGKTYLLLMLAAVVTRGYNFPDQEGHVAPGNQPPANVLYITAEDGLADTIHKRATACEADLERFFVVPPSSLFPEDLQPFSLARPHLLSAAITERQAKLVILDPLTAFLGAEMDMHRANEVRPLMSKLVTIATEHHCAMVAIRHWTKAVGNRAAYRGQGNIDFLAAARSVLAVGESPEVIDQRMMAQSKNSIEEKGISQVFEITNEGFQWAGTSSITADELSAAQPQRHKKQRQNAMEWLKDFLKEGPQRSLLVTESARAVGINEKALRRAKEALGVLAAKDATTWYWRLPKFQKWERYPGMEEDDD